MNLCLWNGKGPYFLVSTDAESDLAHIKKINDQDGVGFYVTLGSIALLA
jgi:hypothetical protein